MVVTWEIMELSMSLMTFMEYTRPSSWVSPSAGSVPIMEVSILVMSTVCC